MGQDDVSTFVFSSGMLKASSYWKCRLLLSLFSTLNVVDLGDKVKGEIALREMANANWLAIRQVDG